MGKTSGKINFASKRKIKSIDVEDDALEGGASFRLQSLNVGQLGGLKEGSVTDTAQLLALSIVDDAGQQLYTVDEIREMPLSIYTPLMQVMNELNGITAKAIEDAAKKSGASQTTDSASV